MVRDADLPFDGFEVHPLYDDFTTPTFDDRHNMIKGGAWVSTGNESRHVSRYAFRRHFFQHAGFRYIVADAPVSYVSSSYESDALLSQYAEFHYGEEYFGAEFPAGDGAERDRRVRTPRRRARGPCAGSGLRHGRTSFELARRFDHVTGIDFSARFINAGVKLAQQGALRYTLQDEGELVFYRECRLAGLGLDAVAGKGRFFAGRRLQSQARVQRLRSHRRRQSHRPPVQPAKVPRNRAPATQSRWPAGAQLALYLARCAHPAGGGIGGFKKDGELHHARRPQGHPRGALRACGGPQAVPFVIRETRRKFQHTLSEMTVAPPRLGAGR